MLKKLIPLLSILFFLACGSHQDKRLHVDVSGVKVPEVVINRYDQELFRIPLSDLKNGLERIKSKYRVFLGTNLDDPAKISSMRSYLTNERNIDFYKASAAKYKDLGTTEQELTLAFQHYKFYFQEAVIPGIYSYISGGDYENPVQINDSVMIIALDTYLGKDFNAYQADGVPLYKISRMGAENIVPDCINALADRMCPVNPSHTNLLGQMIEAGKKLYFIDAMIPDFPDYLKISYTKAQYEWIEKNEYHIWAAIIENRMLYSTSSQVIRMFMADGPFTSEFSKDSPPRLGEWIGWQIVKQFMNENPDVTLQKLLSLDDPQQILTRSGYKPEK